MAQAVNPFLPLNEYVPDGEPHVFGDRIYLFGSHDKEGGESFCLLDYVVWSAPLSDLSQWSNTGVTYSARQDPLYEENVRCHLYAPDVVQGNDGRFYLYYCLSGFKGEGGYRNPVSVAVSDRPDGKYEYLGFVRTPDGAPYMRYVCFDPAVINDAGTIRLYYGTCYPFEEYGPIAEKLIFSKVMENMFGRRAKMGAVTVELCDDMMTVKGEALPVIPTKTKKTGYAGHAFFEGSSIRKIGETYYFIYSSFLNHELCYATSRYPDRDFVYGGTIISTGDIGLNGRAAKDRLNHTGTTHGSIECINGQWYVFYHRLTHGSGYSRQACAEPIRIEPDGSIRQVRISSCGLNGGPLKAEGEYPSGIACVLTDGHMEHGGNSFTRKPHPNHTHCGQEHFITGITDGTVIGMRSFVYKGRQVLGLTSRGEGCGTFSVATKLDGDAIGSIPSDASLDWRTVSREIPFPAGDGDLYRTYHGTGSRELLSISFDGGNR